MTMKKQYYHGIKPVEFVWHGEWADPEIIYHGISHNYWDLDYTMYQIAKENGISDDDFEDWIGKNPDTVLSVMDDMEANWCSIMGMEIRQAIILWLKKECGCTDDEAKALWEQQENDTIHLVKYESDEHIIDVWVNMADMMNVITSFLYKHKYVDMRIESADNFICWLESTSYQEMLEAVYGGELE